MKDTKPNIRQFQHECDAWKRTLEFLLLENSFLKNRLAETLNSSDLATDFLETAEHYQARFIQKDEIINLMRQDVAEQNQLLERDIYEDGILYKTVVHQQKRLRKEIKSLESSFNKLKIQFDKYLAVAW